MPKEMVVRIGRILPGLPGLEILVKRPVVDVLPTWKVIICGIRSKCSTSTCSSSSTHQVSDLSGQRIPGAFCAECSRRISSRLLRKYRKLTGDRSES